MVGVGSVQLRLRHPHHPMLAAFGAGGWAEAGDRALDEGPQALVPACMTLGEVFLVQSLSFPTYEVTFMCTPVSGSHLGQAHRAARASLIENSVSLCLR